MSNRKVLILRMHSAILVAGGVGTVGHTLNANDINTNIKSLTMELTPAENVLVKGVGTKGVKFEILVPSAMCVSIQLVPEAVAVETNNSSKTAPPK